MPPIGGAPCGAPPPPCIGPPPPPCMEPIMIWRISPEIACAWSGGSFSRQALIPVIPDDSAKNGPLGGTVLLAVRRAGLQWPFTASDPASMSLVIAVSACRRPQRVTAHPQRCRRPTASLTFANARETCEASSTASWLRRSTPQKRKAAVTASFVSAKAKGFGLETERRTSSPTQSRHDCRSPCLMPASLTRARPGDLNAFEAWRSVLIALRRFRNLVALASFSTSCGRSSTPYAVESAHLRRRANRTRRVGGGADEPSLHVAGLSGRARAASQRCRLGMHSRYAVIASVIFLWWLVKLDVIRLFAASWPSPGPICSPMDLVAQTCPCTCTAS